MPDRLVRAWRAGRIELIAQDPPGDDQLTRDPKDDYLVRLVRGSGIAVLVSGDRDLLEADIDDVETLTPRSLLDRIGGDSDER